MEFAEDNEMCYWQLVFLPRVILLSLETKIGAPSLY